ncbi:MAG: tRNA glutamyl-Q(34) synthetase GluQRS [Flaviflexus sp.]|uniref:tRNA glutamyl-Q(34) synthetase GluQRS n=1 Tax=Flaviflexus sp. TaxID=1969482 RepID=UPI00352E2ADF
MSSVRVGRYAPSPSGDLHVGNLRTALIAWACARKSDLGFVMRMEDLDERARPGYVDSQLRDLAALGIDWDGEVLFQSQRAEAYEAVVRRLLDEDLLYECYCTRADIRDAPTASHAPPGSYPGTCRDLSEYERELGRAKLENLNRGPALRLRTNIGTLTFVDEVCGEFTGHIDDFVVVRGDGVMAYNLVAVVDDEFQNVGQIVRADDLLESTPRQIYLQNLLRYRTPTYFHVPLVVNEKGQRLAKRDGAVTLKDLSEKGMSVSDVFALISRSLGIDAATAPEFLEAFEFELPREPWVFQAPQ